MTTARKSYLRTATKLVSGSVGEASIMISTVDQDREGDVLVPEGARTENYRKNPVVLFGHDSRSLPIGRATTVSVSPGQGIRAEWTWLKNDPMADRVRNAFEQGVLNAASVGFLPRKWEPNGPAGLRYTDWELLEFSLVPVPANANAVRALKALGLPYEMRESTEVAVVFADEDPFSLEAIERSIRECVDAELRGSQAEGERIVVDDELATTIATGVAEAIREGFANVTGRLD